MRNNFPNSNFRLSIISLLAGRPRPCDQDPELDAGLSASVPTLLPPPERAAYPSAVPLPPEPHDAGPLVERFDIEPFPDFSAK